MTIKGKNGILGKEPCPDWLSADLRWFQGK